MASDLGKAIQRILDRRDEYALYQAYYDGEHRLAFASDKFKSAFGNLFQAFADNLCPAVIEAVADRLVITGFQTVGTQPDTDPRIPQIPEVLAVVDQGPVPGGTEPPVQSPVTNAPSPIVPSENPGETPGETPDEPALTDPADIAWNLWEQNMMALQAGEIHQEAGILGDAYLIVWPDPETNQPVFDAQLANQCTVFYDPENRRDVLWGAKLWENEDGYMRVNCYYKDRIEKWISLKVAKGIISTDEDDYEKFATPRETWPLKNPYDTVPIFHFPTNTRLGQFGKSDLKDAIPLQDALNKAVADMLVGMEFTAFPQRWVVGLEVEIDESTGRPLAPFVPGEDRIWAVGDKEVRFGEFPAAALTNYLQVQDNLRMEIARVTGTPVHYLMLAGGSWPSGEALTIAEVRLTNKCLDRELGYGVIWGRAFSFALKILEIDGAVTPEWTDPAPQSPLTEMQVLTQKKNLDIPQEVLWKDMGYTDAEIVQMRQIHQAAAMEQVRMMALSTIATTPPPPPGGPPGQ